MYCCGALAGSLETDLVEQSGDLHASAYGSQEMGNDPIYRRNLELLRSVRGEERIKYYADRIPDGLSKEDLGDYITLKVCSPRLLS